MKQVFILSIQQPEHTISAPEGFTQLVMQSACLAGSGPITQELFSIRLFLQNKDHSFDCRSWLNPETGKFGSIDLLQTAGQVPALSASLFTRLVIKTDQLTDDREITVEMDYLISE